MGCCLFASILAGAPRLAFLIYWLVAPVRVQTAFHTFIVPLLGLVFLPWTTLMFVIVAPAGVVTGFAWVWLILAFLVDIGTYGSGARGRSASTSG